jgi:hypothetical protein
VFVPIGTENMLTGLGIFENSQQPELFLPGTGTWEARFDGNKLTWAVVTYNGVHKTSTASNASSTSNKCSKSSEYFSTNDVSQVEFNILNAYPNPTTGKVYFTLGDRVLSAKDVVISDLYGRTMNLGISRTSGSLLEIDFTEQPSGVYLIRIMLDGEQQHFRIVKQ